MNSTVEYRDREMYEYCTRFVRLFHAPVGPSISVQDTSRTGGFHKITIP
jgi:hypothetical protein